MKKLPFRAGTAPARGPCAHGGRPRWRLALPLLASAALAPAARSQPKLAADLALELTSKLRFQESYPGAGAWLDRVPGGDSARTGPAAGDASDSAGSRWALLAEALYREHRQAGEGAGAFRDLAAGLRGDLAGNFLMADLLERRGLAAPADSFRKATHRTMLEAGYQRVPELAKMSLFQARQALDRGRYREASSDLDFASALDPACPWVPYLRILVAMRQAPPWSWDATSLWRSGMDLFHLMAYGENGMLALLNLSQALRLGLGIFLFAGLAMLLCRHFTRITHLWAERLPHQVDFMVRYSAIAIALAGLWIAGLGIMALGLLATILLWKPSPPPERTILRLYLLGLLALPAWLLAEKSCYRLLDRRAGLSLFERAYSRGYETALVNDAQAFRPANGADSVHRALALSLACKKLGNYRQAEEYANAALSLDERNPEALLALGNLAFLKYEYEGAADYYKRARDADPGRMEAWFNSSQLELFNNNSAKNKEYLDRAGVLDAQYLTAYLKANDEHFTVPPPNRRVMDPRPRAASAWKAARDDLAGLRFDVANLDTGLLDIPSRWLPAAALFTALFLFLRYRRYSPLLRGKDLFECKICGRTTCRVCRKGVHCHRCFKAVAGLNDPRLRHELIARLRGQANRARSILALAFDAGFPGAGRVYLGGGGRFLWPMATALAMGFTWKFHHLVKEYPDFALGPVLWLSWLPLAFLYAFSLARLARAGFPAPAPEKDPF